VSVFKVAKSPYYRYSFDIDTRRFEGSTKKRNKPDALKVEEEKREEAKKLLKAEASGAKDRDNLRPMAIETACALYHVDVMTGKPSADDVLDQLDLLSRRIGRHTLCEHIDTAEVTRIRGLRRNDIKKSGSGRGVDLVSDSTVNRDTTSLLRRVLNHVSEMHGVRLHREPIKWDKLKLKEPEGRSRELSFEEEPRLLTELEKINEYLVDPMTVSVILGQRQEPIIHLKWTEYFPLQRVIKIILKGGKVHEVPLTDEVIAIIESHRGEHTEYVFTYVCRRGGGGRNARDGIRRVKGQRYPFSKSGWRMPGSKISSGTICAIRRRPERSASLTWRL
jgi:hypothetical protein